MFHNSDTRIPPMSKMGVGADEPKVLALLGATAHQPADADRLAIRRDNRDSIKTEALAA
jgi:hypothetical protein